MLQLGWKAAPEQFPPTKLTTYAIDAEKAGFDFIILPAEVGSSSCDEALDPPHPPSALVREQRGIAQQQRKAGARKESIL